MGANFSGELSDCTFYNKVERATVLTEWARSKYGIKRYLRYRDDVCIIMNEKEDRVNKLVGDMNKAGEPHYEIKPEETGKENIQMLDTELTI